MRNDAGQPSTASLPSKPPKQGISRRILMTWLTAVVLAEVLATGITWPTVLQRFQPPLTTTVIVNAYDPPHNTLALNEMLHKNSNVGWVETSGSCLFTAAGYHVIAQATLAQACVAHKTNFSDMTFEVQMSLLSGTGGGMLLRATSLASYYFGINSNGYFTLFVCTGTGMLCDKILSTGFSQSIVPGLHQFNRIAVVARGTHIDLYANYERIVSVNDSTSLSGQIGVAAEVGSEVVFSNARVWTA